MKIQNKRFLSLDVLRGLTISFMIIVNTPGNGAIQYSPLRHAGWHGFTPTDLVFPSFLFVVGNAMSFSLDKYRLISNASFLKKIFKRTFLIFLLGYLMYWFPFFRLNDAGEIISAPFSETRLPGVLQRIALCYCFGSLMIHYLSTRKVIITSVLLLVGYWVLLLVFGDAQQPFSLMGNAVLYMDKALMSSGHIYHGEGIVFDPEGWLSTLPAIVNVVIGYYAGRFIQTNGKTYETISKLMLVGVSLIFIALWWNMVFPINKKLWTSPFVLLTTGIDLLILSVLIYALEIKNWNKGNWTRFFIIFGKNPLFLYLLSEVLIIIIDMILVQPHVSLFTWVNTHFFQVIAPGSLGSFMFAIIYMLICWLVGWWMNAKKIYVKV